MTASSVSPPLPVCPRCGSATETFIATWVAPGVTGWGESKPVPWLARVTACTGCEWAKEGR